MNHEVLEIPLIAQMWLEILQRFAAALAWLSEVAQTLN
jgi:hypothetical protein